MLIDTGNDHSLWSGRGSVGLVCQEGDPFPPAGPGVSLSCPSVNSLGAAVAVPGSPLRVLGNVFLFGVGDTNRDTAVAVLDGSSGSKSMVAREGDVAPDTALVFDQLQGDLPPGVDDGGATHFNDAGQVTFKASFTDGSEGLFLSQPEAVLLPEIFFDGFESGDVSSWSMTSP